ncbi:MAG: VOC family protein [Chloroflexi bacterium]|nr:VOC family protein [Chloroflexota bacterium]
MIRGIQHCGIAVSNLDETVRFFRDILGLQAAPIREVKSRRIEQLMKRPGASTRLCFLSTPDGGNIEFTERVLPAGDKVDMSLSSVGVAHLAFEVDDIQKMYRELTAKKIEFNQPPYRIETGPFQGWGVCFLKGPDGMTVELMEAAKA